MDNYSVFIHQAVYNDIDEILVFYFEQSQDIILVESISNLIFESIESLSYMPYRYQVSDIDNRYRRLPINRYNLAIYYEIVGRSVHIYSVNDTRRNIAEM